MYGLNFVPAATDGFLALPTTTLGTQYINLGYQNATSGIPEQLVNGSVPPEDKVSAVFDLLEGVVAAQMDRLAILLGELGAQQPSPVIEPLANPIGAEAVGSGL